MNFECYEIRKPAIDKCLAKYNLASLQAADVLLKSKGVDAQKLIKGIQPICFEDAWWAYVLGGAIALQSGEKDPAKLAEIVGEGLQAFCIPGSVADQRQIGIGHGKLAARLLSEETECFAMVAGHDSFAGAEGANAITNSVKNIRKKPLRVILLGLGKDAAYMIARISGFTYVQTDLNYATGELLTIGETAFSSDIRANVKCYGAHSIDEGVAIMKAAGADVSITGNATNMSRFTIPVVGTYKKWCVDNGKAYFSVASGGGTGRSINPDEAGAGAASYGLTDSLGKMHADAQFAGSSSVPGHVEMMGYIGMGNNPMVGATVTMAVTISGLK